MAKLAPQEPLCKLLPPGIAKQALPIELVDLLPPLPRGYERVVLTGKVILVEVATQVIHDVLEDVIIGLLAEEGTIDPELREAITSAILGTKDMPGMLRYWRQRKSYLHADFAAYVDELFTLDTVNTVDVYRTQKTEQEE